MGSSMVLVHISFSDHAQDMYLSIVVNLNLQVPKVLPQPVFLLLGETNLNCIN